jgi:anti-sigma factor RsiW
MKDAKFIELLNLYVDHQISPEEAEQLEAEVRSSPERRRVYHEYCQMQKACSVIAETFRTEAPASAPKVADFKVRRSSPSAVAYVGGLLAVAACVAVLLSVRSSQRANLAPAAPVLTATVQPTVSAPVASTVSRPALQPVLGPRLLTVREPGADSAELAAVDPAAFGEWMNSVQLSSLSGASGDELQFDTRATVPTESRSLHARRPYQGKVEWTAFTFQK